jgi:hypothetical protein
MANSFKNSIIPSIGTSPIDVYTAGPGVTATIISLSIANRIDFATTVDVQITDSSTSNTAFLIKSVAVDPGAAFVLAGADQKIVLESADKITVTSSLGSSVDCVISILEQV